MKNSGQPHLMQIVLITTRLHPVIDFIATQPGRRIRNLASIPAGYRIMNIKSLRFVLICNIEAICGMASNTILHQCREL